MHDNAPKKAMPPSQSSPSSPTSTGSHKEQTIESTSKQSTAEAALSIILNKTGTACAAPPRFADLWAGYPSGHPSSERWADDVVERGVLLGRKGDLKYPDQCSLKVSAALHAAGVDMRGYAGAYTMLDGKRGALRAAELAAWLGTQAFCQGAAPQLRATGANWQSQVAGKTGIIYFANYWRRAGETAPSGDHIDLWDGESLTPSIESFLRFKLGIDHIANPLERLHGRPGNWYSNLNAATEILMWQIA